MEPRPSRLKLPHPPSAVLTPSIGGFGLKSPRRRRPPRHRVRRQRMPREGMLIQVDGSHHRWLGDDGPQFTLLLAVDDATGIVVNAMFCEQENTRDYFLLMRGLIQRYGIRTCPAPGSSVHPRSSVVRWMNSVYRWSSPCHRRPRVEWSAQRVHFRTAMMNPGSPRLGPDPFQDWHHAFNLICRLDPMWRPRRLRQGEQ